MCEFESRSWRGVLNAMGGCSHSVYPVPAQMYYEMKYMYILNSIYNED